MRILIDGDSAHRLADTEKIAKEKNIPCHIYCDASRNISSKYSTVHTVDVGSNSADMAIANQCRAGDLVVTNDIGLAALALAKKAYAMNNCGLEYTDGNIMAKLTERHAREERRRKTGRKAAARTCPEAQPHGSFKDTLNKITEKAVRK